MQPRSAVTFYVQKSLAHAPIRFGVSPRRPTDVIDDEPALSTGRSGEFVRRRTHGYFFADNIEVAQPSVQPAPSIRSTPFYQSLLPDGTARGWVLSAALVFGAFIVLLGLIVLATGGADRRAAGLIEVVFGLIIAAIPVALTAQRRRSVAAEEERERIESAEREKRHREILASYSTALVQLRDNPGPETLTAALREREKLDAPYKIWAPLARRTVLEIGFNALAELGTARGAEVSERMSRAAEAVGLTAEDEERVKTDVYRAVLWHLLADDRIGKVQAEQLMKLRADLGISDEHISEDIDAAEQFEALRGMTTKNLPRQQCDLAVGFGEYCIHTTPVTYLDEKNHESPATLFITNKRVVIAGKKMQEVPVAQIDDVEVEAEKYLLTVRIPRPARPLRMRLAKAIYAASLIDLATALDERPRGFA